MNQHSGDRTDPQTAWARLREILSHVLALPANQQAAYLDQSCQGEPALRAEVESLVTAAQGKSLLDLPATIVGSPNLDALIGRRLGDYEIIARIGEGGMGAVYRAIDQTLGRPVALKVMSRGYIGESDRRRFAREARAGSALNHPNIVTVYQFASADGIDFLAMEYVEGHPLSKVLSSGPPLDLPQAISVARQIAAALAKAHAAGIVHRDLKPANIMLTPEGTVKVLDFGLAKLIRHDAEKSAELTLPHTVLGTPGYMSPEQALGEEADARSDIFSFGVILYELLSGQRAFKGSDAASALRMVMYKEPPKLSALNPSVPGELAALVEKCMAKDRDQRLVSMQDILSVLTPAEASTATLQTAPALTLGPAATSRRLLLPGIGVVVLLASGGLLWRNQKAQPAPSAVSPQLPQTSVGYFQQGTALLTRLDRKNGFQEATAAFQKAIQLDPSNAAAYAGLAEAYLNQIVARNTDAQWPKLAMDAAQKAVDLNPYLSAAQATAGLASFHNGQREDGLSRITKALELDPNSALAHSYRGLCLEAVDNASQAEAEYRKAVALAPSDWRYHQRLGIFLRRGGRLAESLASFETSARLTPDNAIANANLGGVYYELGRLEEAASAFQRSIEVLPSARGFTNLGTLLYFLGRYRDSASAFERALALDANSYLRWGNLGDANRWVPGATEKSKDAFSQAIRLVREEITKQPANADLRASLAAYLAKSGDTTQALRELEAIKLPPKPTGGLLFKIAIVNEICGRRPQALAALDKAIQAGHSLKEIQSEPELLALRKDPGYHRLLAR